MIQKGILSILLAWGLIDTSMAQNVFQGGILAGMSATQVEGDNYGGYDKPGFIGGGLVKTDLSESLALQMELTYINKGSRKVPNPKEGDYSELLIKLNYVEIPLALRYKIDKFHLEGGPYYGRLIKSYMEGISGELSIDPPFKNYDLGGFLGVSYFFNDNIAFNMRSKASLLPVRDIEPYISYWFNKGWYNLGLNFSLRYVFKSKNEKGE